MNCSKRKYRILIVASVFALALAAVLPFYYYSIKDKTPASALSGHDNGSIWELKKDTMAEVEIGGVVFKYFINAEGNATIYEAVPNDKNTTEVTFPSEINGYAVTEIGHNVDPKDPDDLHVWYSGPVIKGTGNISKVVIPEGVKYLGAQAFFQVRALKTVILPKSLEVIESFAFANCTALESINIKGLKKLEFWAFSGCSNLTEVKLPEGLESIESLAFDGCNLSSLRLPSTLQYVENSAFCNMGNVEMLVFPPGVEFFGTKSSEIEKHADLMDPDTYAVCFVGSPAYNLFRTSDFRYKAIVYGDISGDNKLNNVDLLTMRKKLANGNMELSLMKELAADLNFDGKIDNKDLLILRKLLAES